MTTDVTARRRLNARRPHASPSPCAPIRTFSTAHLFCFHAATEQLRGHVGNDRYTVLMQSFAYFEDILQAGLANANADAALQHHPNRA